MSFIDWITLAVMGLILLVKLVYGRRRRRLRAGWRQQGLAVHRRNPMAIRRPAWRTALSLTWTACLAALGVYFILKLSGLVTADLGAVALVVGVISLDDLLNRAWDLNAVYYTTEGVCHLDRFHPWLEIERTIGTDDSVVYRHVRSTMTILEGPESDFRDGEWETINGRLHHHFNDAPELP